jgi:hypothetical protein
MLAMLTPASAAAATSLIAIDDSSPDLTQGDDESWSGTLSVTNLTDGALQLSATPAGTSGGDCKVELSREAIGAAQSLEMNLAVASACDVTGDSFDLTLTASGETTQDLSLAASTKPGDADPDWGELLAFPVALLAALIVLSGRFLKPGKPNDDVENAPPNISNALQTRRYFASERLEYLPATYTFKDSWVSNITVIAGLLTGIFGSAEVVKAFLGDDAERAIALATVGSAVGVILVGAGVVILTAARSQRMKEGRLSESFTAGGLVGATAVTVGGAFGQLWIGWKTGAEFDLGGWEDALVAAFALAALLLLWYTFSTLRASLRARTTAPPPPKPSELAQLIEVVKAALKKDTDVPDEKIPSIVEDLLLSSRWAGTSPGDDPYVSRRTTAMP